MKTWAMRAPCMVLTPLAWRGVLCHGPDQGSKITFTSPASQYPGWGKTPDPDEAAPTVIAAYLGAHGPATPEVFDRWLSLNSTSRARLRQRRMSPPRTGRARRPCASPDAGRKIAGHRPFPEYRGGPLS